MARVLVVDDEQPILVAISRMLPKGTEVVTAETAEQAAALLSQQEFDVVIADRQMPGRDGLWLLEQVQRQQPRALRVLSSGASFRDLDAHLASGLVQRWLPKPVGPSDLHACLSLR